MPNVRQKGFPAKSAAALRPLINPIPIGPAIKAPRPVPMGPAVPDGGLVGEMMKGGAISPMTGIRKKRPPHAF